jgi:hypothetical protein
MANEPSLRCLPGSPELHIRYQCLHPWAGTYPRPANVRCTSPPAARLSSRSFAHCLLSARFGSTDALLDVLGRMQLDAYIDDSHVRTCRNPSDQGRSGTCYAHASAAVLHMAMLRIVDREGGYPSIEDIRTKILDKFPSRPGGWPVEEVLRAATTWYRPLCFRKVDEESARQAVLRRRPVLSTFRLSQSDWDTFDQHIGTTATASSVLTYYQMAPHRLSPPGGGHAVVLTSYDPRSLTFMNSWGYQLGNNGSFSVENPSVLGIDGTIGELHPSFYDIYWVEGDLTATERQAYETKVDDALRPHTEQYPIIFKLEAHCPKCQSNTPIADFIAAFAVRCAPMSSTI